MCLLGARLFHAQLFQQIHRPLAEVIVQLSPTMGAVQVSKAESGAAILTGLDLRQSG